MFLSPFMYQLGVLNRKFNLAVRTFRRRPSRFGSAVAAAVKSCLRDEGSK